MSNMVNSCGCGPCICGCCEGVKVVTPLSTANPPGLPALSYRAGTHATFFESMIASLTTSGDPHLLPLGTRSLDDPAIAFLDGWATIADILTFYQQRIANEGYLRTAVERRSVLDLARLIGYRMRPGVAASAYLAYTIDPQYSGDAIIPAGTRSTSVPGPGELPRTFETSDDLLARASWNLLQPRLTRPQTPDSIATAAGGRRIYLQGVSSNLKANDPVLIEPAHDVFRVASVAADALANRTLVDLNNWFPKPATNPAGPVPVTVEQLAQSEALFRPVSVPPANSRQLDRSLTISVNSDSSYRLFDAFMPESGVNLLEAVQNAAVAPESEIRAYAFRVKASLFANNLPGTPSTTISRGTASANDTSQVIATTYIEPTFESTAGAFNTETDVIQTLALDAEYNLIKFGDWIVVDYPDATSTNPRVRHISTVKAVETRTLTLGGVSAKVTLVTINDAIPKAEKLRAAPEFIRGTIVYAQSELLPLAEEVIAAPVCGGGNTEIELDGLYTGLEPGRWLIITGERADIPGTSGVQATELLMLSEVRHGVAEVVLPATQIATGGTAVKLGTKASKAAAKAAKLEAAASAALSGATFSGTAASATQNKPTPLPGDKTHTFIKVASNLAYCYRRDKVQIYGNVVHATDGETTSESLGNGDASRPFQQFMLKQNPLTYVSAATVSGVESTLQVLVNDVRWHESDSLAGMMPHDRKFVTKTDDDGKTTVVFGDGVRGARTPSGLDNIRGRYRKGIGKGGNLNAAQISQLGDRPLGVQAVVNPLPSTGGADAETRDQGRRNAPLATTALDRLVSTPDYADFARTFAGVSKASSIELPGRLGQIVHVTIAGVDDIPIAESSDLFRNLRTAMIRYGDPLQPLQLAVRERILLVLSAGVKVNPDYLWEKVEPQVRAAVLEVFGFDQRDLGQDAFLSEAVAAMQAVEGVEYVEVDSFGGVFGLKPNGDRVPPSEIAAQIAAIDAALPQNRVASRLARFTGTTILPAQVAYFAADQPQTLVLNEVKI